MPVAFCLLPVCLALGQAASKPSDTYHPGRLVIKLYHRAPCRDELRRQLEGAPPEETDNVLTTP